MINFRFHLVSLVAVFLALGLGILVGSTVIDQGIVNRLDSEINSVRKENSAREATSKQLSEQNRTLQQFIDQSAPFVGDGRLDSLSIAVVAEHGVNRGDVKQTAQALVAAGAEVPGVVWLDDAWRLDSDSRVQALQAALGLSGTASSMRDTALDLLVRRLAKAPTSRPTTTTKPASGASTSLPEQASTPSTPSITPIPSVAPVDALTALDKAGFVTVTDGKASDFATFPTHPVNVLVITGDDSDFAGGDFTATFVRAVVGANLPTVVGAVYDPGSNPADAPERGASLSSILDDRALSRSASTVDDLDLVPQGQEAVVLSLEVIGSGNVGHYGYGPGTSGPLPPHHS